MPTPEPRRRLRFWQPDTQAVIGMLRLEHEDRIKTSYAEHFSVVVIDDGMFEGWYRGGLMTHVPGALKLKEPGEVHRGVRVLAPFTLQGAAIAPEQIAAAADALGVRGAPHFVAPGFGPETHAAGLARAMHDALTRATATELERTTLVAETLAAVIGRRRPRRSPRAVQRARAYLRETLSERVTLDALAEHAALDKFHLARAFRSEVGLAPYEYLTHLRVDRARELLRTGVRVAEVAQAVGFYDESQLHRHFRRIVGVTPGAYARSFATVRSSRQHRPSRARAPVA